MEKIERRKEGLSNIEHRLGSSLGRRSGLRASIGFASRACGFISRSYHVHAKVMSRFCQSHES